MKSRISGIVDLILFMGIGGLIAYANFVPGSFRQLNSSPKSSPTAIVESPEATPSPSVSPQPTNGGAHSDEELRATVLPGNNIIYPDLVLSDPIEVGIERGDDVKNLLLDTAFANIGEGDLHLYGTEQEDRFFATQILMSSTGNEYHDIVGDFLFKDEHDHWHLENFANYELWSVGSHAARDELVASTVKVSS